MSVGTFAACLHGTAFQLLMIVFGDMIDSFIANAKNATSSFK